ncbi:MAG TPA: twin-arginine translocation signal domain-containing protein [Blastocatellia bacterium]|nr:twin-arginine translocation signal domain-containing protein [Blastocatellia bacterium]
MKDKKQENQERRNFLKVAGSAALAAGCFAAMSTTEIRALVAVAAATNKPLLTEKNLNDFIKSIPNSDRQSYANKAFTDLKGFLNDHFTLSTTQQSQIDELKGQSLLKLEQGVRDAIQNNKALQIKLPVPRAQAMMPKNQQSNPNRTAAVEVGGDVNVNVVTINY